MFATGLQTPLIPLLEIVGSVNAAPEQMDETCVNSGVTLAFTVTVMVVVNAHCPAVGVKVYVVVAAVLIAGLQEPMIPLFEVAGSVNDVPEQMA